MGGGRRGIQCGRKKIYDCCILPEITSAQVKLLTAYGFEVIHHRAIYQAICAKIPIIVRNVVNPTGAGTRVETTTSRGPAQLAKLYKPPSVQARTFAVIIMNELELVDIRLRTGNFFQAVTHFLLNVLKNDKHRNITMDLVTSSQDEVSLVMSATRDGGVLEILEEVKRVALVTITRG
ncbi:hypothetical protein H2248_011172 [Termitomyces sp. 'cryptogamus']|nr:hypothetical protein H2248_011172 [Termitomyces sp. 'cryptogamus']